VRVVCIVHSSVTQPSAAEDTVLMYLCIVPRVYFRAGATHFALRLDSSSGLRHPPAPT
jgi:hypothetical protein